MDKLYRLYQGRDKNLRQLMYIMQTALTVAIDEHAEHIEEAHVIVALTRIGR